MSNHSSGQEDPVHEYLELREEKKPDFDAITRLHDIAFGSDMESGIVSSIRQVHRSYLSCVAVTEAAICGHVLFSEVDIIGAEESRVAIALGPVSVMPAYQGQGIGGKLIRYGLGICSERRYPACFVLGDPAYYSRFGFCPAFAAGFWYSSHRDRPAFQILSWSSSHIGLPSGEVRYAPMFYEDGMAD